MAAGQLLRNSPGTTGAAAGPSPSRRKAARLFEENLAIAEKHFVKAWEINPKLPEAPAAMISVAMATGGDARQWFDRAVAAEMDYVAAYRTYLERR